MVAGRLVETSREVFEHGKENGFVCEINLQGRKVEVYSDLRTLDLDFKGLLHELKKGGYEVVGR